MPIPDYQSLMLPLLQLCADGNEHRFSIAVEALAVQHALTPEERKTLLPSGRAPLFQNRVGWARFYLKKSGLISAPRYGYFTITNAGRDVIAKKPPRIDGAFLATLTPTGEVGSETGTPQSNRELIAESAVREQTPEERIANAYEQVQQGLEAELLDQVLANTPEFFERLVVDLLLAMGYGGSRRDAGSAVGRSGDGGVDGVIKEDRLGLGMIYLQAKRWQNPVGRPEIQQFVGALQERFASKGVFITTSTFSKGAIEVVTRLPARIVLIDGAELVRLMVEHDVGVSAREAYVLKAIDKDYFELE